MEKIEKMRQEIERRIALYSGWSNETVHPTRIDEDRQLLSFLDTLSEEPGKSMEETTIDMDKIEEIRTEIDRHIKHYEKLERNDFQNGELYICQELLFFIDSLRQEQQDLEKEIDKEWKKCNPVDEGMGVESAYMHIEAFDIIARHFYKLGKNSK